MPAQVPGTYVQVAAGTRHSLGLQASGSLLAWGNNVTGQLGNAINLSTTTPNPTPHHYRHRPAHAPHRRTAGPVLDAAGLPAGLYLVRATAPGQAAQAARLLVE